MQRTIKILHLEDNELDAELIRESLYAEGFEFDVVWVKSRAEFEHALSHQTFDVILSDFNLPGYNGLTALKTARERQPFAPGIFVSGSIGEETAVECLKTGVTDYVLKDRPTRLIVAIRRAMDEVEKRRDQERSENLLRSSEAHFRLLVERSADLISRLSPDGHFVYASPVSRKLLGYPPEDLIGRSIYDICHEQDVAALRASHQATMTHSEPVTSSCSLLNHDGQYVRFEAMSIGIRPMLADTIEIHSTLRDISNRSCAAGSAAV